MNRFYNVLLLENLFSAVEPKAGRHFTQHAPSFATKEIYLSGYRPGGIQPTGAQTADRIPLGQPVLHIRIEPRDRSAAIC